MRTLTNSLLDFSLQQANTSVKVIEGYASHRPLPSLHRFSV